MKKNTPTNLSALADHIHDTLFSSHRGALPIGSGLTAIYGNDGFLIDTRSRREVEAVLSELEERKIEVVGLGTNTQGGYTWVLVVKSADVESLDGVVWAAWSPLFVQQPTKGQSESRRERARVAGRRRKAGV